MIVVISRSESSERCLQPAGPAWNVVTLERVIHLVPGGIQDSRHFLVVVGWREHRAQRLVRWRPSPV
jgi:hypothetical protein